MSLLFSPRLLIGLALVAALAFSHLVAYRKGSAHVRQEWLAAVSAANSEAQRLERARQSRVDDAQKLAAVRESRIRADAVRAGNAVVSLRDTIRAIERASADSLAAANNAVRVYGDILQSCGAEYQRVAEEADRAASEVRTLRDAWPK